MDEQRAKLLEASLKGSVVGGWKVGDLKGNGKSAAVFLARKGNKRAALKIFDTELIKKFGSEIQLARIERELTLIGKHHPNMVKILGGGHDSAHDIHYIVMEFVDGPNMKECLQDIPPKNVPALLSQLASAAQFLETLDLVHRDIKPENIVLIEDHTKLILLDFGVVKPIGEPGVTDMEGLHPFVGTLQYSSPEFLLREEDNDRNGWRALTFYQIGGVLHDLIMRRSLFSEHAEPFAKLVNAVQEVVPQIQSSDIPSHFVELARSCLLKKPELRLQLVTWESFSTVPSDGLDSLKERVTNRTVLCQAEQETPAAPVPQAEMHVRDATTDFLKATVRLVGAKDKLFPPIKTISLPNKHTVKVRLTASTSHCLPHGLTILLGVRVLDGAARVISVNASAFSGEAAPGKPPTPVTVCEGPLDTDSMVTALENCLYAAVDVAQQTAAIGSVDLTTLAGDEKE